MGDLKSFAASYMPGLKHATKTAIAAAASLYLAKFMKMPEGYWAAITAIIVMQSNVGATLTASWTRLVGTAIGAVVAGVFVQFFGTSTLHFGIAVLLVVLICDLAGLADAYRLAGVTVAIVMLINRLAPAWAIAGERFLQVGLGIVVGILTSVLVWPSRARESLRAGLAEALSAMGALFQSVIECNHAGDSRPIEEIRSHVKEILRRSDDLHVQAAHEGTAYADREVVAVLMDRAGRLLETVDSLLSSGRGCFEGSYYLDFKPEIDRLGGEISEAFKQLARSVAEWRFHATWPDFTEMLSKLENKVSELRASGASTKYPLEEVLRFYSFLFTLKNLANELDHLHAASSRIAGTGSPD
jgi:uncharacterized membrane protein YgaE (UPF0421/DUF939 family)